MKNLDVCKIENMHRKKMGMFTIRWMVTSFCNYNCDFCIQGSRELKIKAAETESSDTRKVIAFKLVTWIEKNISPHQIVELNLIGGEVSALPDFLELIHYLVNSRFKGIIFFRLTTNLSRQGKYYEDLCELFHGRNNRFISISASYYRAYTTPDVFEKKLFGLQHFIIHRKHFYKLLRLSSMIFGRACLPSQGKNLYLSVGWPILDDDSYKEYLKFQSRMAGTGILVSPIIMRDYPITLSTKVQDVLKSKKQGVGIRVTTVRGDVEYFSGIQQLGYQLEDVEKFCPQGYICDAGKESFSISTDGSVLRCPSLNSPKDFYMGNITDESFRLLEKSAICHADHCSCNYYKQIVCSKS